jgi:hypothetical protein
MPYRIEWRPLARKAFLALPGSSYMASSKCSVIVSVVRDSFSDEDGSS